ncbi:MAG: hypothetical protein JXD21_00460 [Candidatus Omnitrophica bacterium]|nr:hypothetical protein [Candidatus Omnitrophota bacterium]
MSRRIKIAALLLAPQIIIMSGVVLGIGFLWIDHREYFVFDRGIFILGMTLLATLFLNCNITFLALRMFFELRQLRQMNLRMEKDLLVFSDIVEKCTKTQTRKIDELSRIMEQHL